MILDFLKKKPYVLFLIFGLVFLFLSFIQTKDSTLDINVHDTYFVVEHSYLMQFIALIFFAFYCFYWTFNKIKFLIKTLLGKIHIYGTILSLIGILYPKIYIFPFFLKENDSLNFFIAILGFLFLFFQLLFFVNFLIGIYKLITRRP